MSFYQTPFLLGLIDICHTNQRLVQLLDVLGIDFKSQLVAGQDRLSGRREVFAVAVDIDDDAVIGQVLSLIHI